MKLRSFSLYLEFQLFEHSKFKFILVVVDERLGIETLTKRRRLFGLSNDMHFILIENQLH